MRRRPNILFLFPDQHRFDWISTYGTVAVRTPHIDALASRGMWFPRAVCPSPLCAPCRAAMARGLAYDRCQVQTNGQNMPDDAATFYQVLRDGGYQVGSCGKLDLRKNAFSWGIDGQHMVQGRSIFRQWGFTHGRDSCGKHDGVTAWRKGLPEPYFAMLEQHGLVDAHVQDFAKRVTSNGTYEYTAPTPLPANMYVDNWVGRSATELLSSFRRDTPWFLQVNFSGPHEPMDVTAAMAERWATANLAEPHRSTQFTPEKHQAIRRCYAAMIENIDAWVGRCIEAVRVRGELDDTLIVYSSDHGEMLGDHDLWGKQHPHQASIGVPLVCAGPGVKALGRVETPVTILDLPATFTEAAELEGLADWDSRSLVPVLRGETRSTRDVVQSGFGHWRTVFDGRYKLVARSDRRTNGSGKVAATDEKVMSLFDLSADPQEDRDIAASESERVNSLARHLPSF